jgi:formate-dependent nitrite reductase cytochrome c552 subunit
VGAKTTADHPGAACPAARKDCASCHMPKARVEDIPVEFTDHQIQVVRRDDAIPK